MARKPSAKAPKRSVRSGKSKAKKNSGGRKRVSTKPGKTGRVPSVAKSGSTKKSTPSARPASRPAAARPQSSAKAKPVAKTPMRVVPAGASARATVKPSRGTPRPGPEKVVPKGGKRASGAPEGGLQGALEFEAEPTLSTFAEKPVALPIPPPRRRNSAKPGSPDWPGESLTVGMMAPEFALPSTLGRKVTLSEFRGKRVIIYFYPKDDTPGCTMEACAFRDHLPRITSKDAVVLGVSLDDELSHQRFAQKYNLPFALLADVDAAVSRQYGTYKEKNLYGRSYWGIERTTFVIDREGRVENVFRRVKVEGHAEEVMATLAI
jgi:thioredoxin-dependent peroxiredoxin